MEIKIVLSSKGKSFGSKFLKGEWLPSLLINIKQGNMVLNPALLFGGFSPVMTWNGDFYTTTWSSLFKKLSL